MKLTNKSSKKALKYSGKKKSLKKKFSPLYQGFIWGGCFTVTATVSGFLGITVGLKTPIDFNPFIDKIDAIKRFGINAFFTQKLTEPINILVMGIDIVSHSDNNSENRFSGRSDTMLLLRFQPEDNSLKLLSIPRDSRVRFPDGNYDKINSANAIGGVPLTKEVIQENFEGITIDKYIRVTTNAFKDLVDLIGGVEVYVPMDMKYTDKTQGLYIDLREGKQTLNGDEAEQFSRFRADNLGDIGRVQRQQMLLKALRQKLQSPQGLFKIPQAIKLLQEDIDTDLTSSEIYNLVAFGLTVDKENVRMVMLPGRPSSRQEYPRSYWLISDDDKTRVIEEYLHSDSSIHDIRSKEQLRISVQNSTYNGELARQLASFLEENGYSNVYVSRNSSYPTAVTQIISQKGDTTSAQEIKDILHFGELEFSSTGDIDADITIRLGNDAEKILLNDTFVK